MEKDGRYIPNHPHFADHLETSFAAPALYRVMVLQLRGHLAESVAFLARLLESRRLP